jgi:hypothetical protein|tara:strand:- start:278 stop:460 length:183 start_codon:yes stop_codon:yes gene_type:complete
MKEEPRKKQWKYNTYVKDLHTNKYRQRIKQPKQSYESEDGSIQDGLEEYFNNLEKDLDDG